MSVSDFGSRSHVGATRKDHQCEACLRKIEIGSPAEKHAGKWEGEFFWQYRHVECAAVETELNRDAGLGGEDWTPLYDWEFDDRSQFIADHPIVADRLGMEEDEIE